MIAGILLHSGRGGGLSDMFGGGWRCGPRARRRRRRTSTGSRSCSPSSGCSPPSASVCCSPETGARVSVPRRSGGIGRHAEVEGLVPARAWGFKSPLRHRKAPGQRPTLVDRLAGDLHTGGGFGILAEQWESFRKANDGLVECVLDSSRPRSRAVGSGLASRDGAGGLRRGVVEGTAQPRSPSRVDVYVRRRPGGLPSDTELRQSSMLPARAPRGACAGRSGRPRSTGPPRRAGSTEPRLAGKGHVERRGSDQWRLVVYRGRDRATGRRRYERRAFRGTEDEAQVAAARLVVELGRMPTSSSTRGG